jgi:NADH dehydrogenase (ubiquinone) 1 alpha subcomplex subunit 9
MIMNVPRRYYQL